MLSEGGKMTFIDDMKNKIMGSIAEENPTASAALELLKNHPGGISGLVQQFHDKGLGDVVNSWVGTGQNLPISADQIKSVLSNEHVQAFAAKAGISPEVASAKIAEVLPMIMDKLTPNGQLPAQGGLIETGMNMLKSLSKTGTDAA
jgi:uncharacterized protein YidB (DUF937 family)